MVSIVWPGSISVPMSSVMRSIILLFASLAIFAGGLYCQKFLASSNVSYSWFITIVLMVTLGYLVDKALKKCQKTS
ncbi:hypothetical protein LCGC14_1817990 [marine sediment metagenome]|uniref:Uncharacterized protein n=1 Tax=marine sediment metagenome TaxID=412755 RepID=A0A0F9GJU4_9ZZZZ